ncbi:MAG: hybrid sensor histidine kinase/response regulator [Burkholderiales bacterium]|nr:hybrid sensor histidine kinase/response regulator [Burkholderiales bacterium]MBK9346980.1 hybrid sensor histidine kinase/response regulator [Burkholderiales bacterium]
MTESPPESPPVLLIVDDTAANLGVIASHLEDSGFEIVIAQSGEDGIKRAQRTLPDLILLDVMMPGIDGFETCKRLKADAQTADIPVIFMTALAETTDKVSGFEAGGVDYITKPIQVAEVLVRINTHLGLRAARRQLMERNAALQHEIETRRQAEAALEQTNQRLARTIETLERTQAQLVLAAKVAGLGAIVTGIAHELNTPIGVAMLTASSLDADVQKMQQMHPRLAEDKVQKESLDRLYKNVGEELSLLDSSLHRAGDLIRKFRMVAVDQLNSRTQVFGLNELVYQTVSEFRIQNTASHRIDIRIDPAITINGYPGALEQVLANLLSNAFQHAFEEPTGGNVIIEGKSHNGWVTLTVGDDGKGIAPERVTRIFDPFYTTQLGKGGSGFGLYAVFNQVSHLMGGHINVESTPGKGTRFILELPCGGTRTTD